MTNLPKSYVSKNKLEALFDILVQPSSAFPAIKEHKKWYSLPFLLTIIFIAVFFSWYFNTVDIEWLSDKMVEQYADNLSAEQIKQTQQSYTKGVLLSSSLVGAIVVMLIVYAIQALYLHLCTRLQGYDHYSFADWFSFTTWCSLPGTINIIILAILYGLSNTNQMEIQDLMATSLSYLLGLSANSTWFNFTNNIGLMLFWSLGLMVYGYRTWVGVSDWRSGVIILTPYIVIYGVWALVLLM